MPQLGAVKKTLAVNTQCVWYTQVPYVIIYVCMYTHTCMSCTYMCTCMYVMYVCAYIHTYMYVHTCTHVYDAGM